MQNLYRHFDKNGTLLYVGVSISAIQRLAQHRDASHWFADIANVTIEQFDTREAVLAAERKAITEENPLHNLMRPAHIKSNRSEKAADDSKSDLVRRIVKFNPTYSIFDVSQILGMSENKIKDLIGKNKIGYICVGEKTGRWGIRKMFRITGWQLIEFIEHLERSSSDIHQNHEVN